LWSKQLDEFFSVRLLMSPNTWLAEIIHFWANLGSHLFLIRNIREMYVYHSWGYSNIDVYTGRARVEVDKIHLHLDFESVEVFRSCSISLFESDFR
jgi:hypothetical protein